MLVLGYNRIIISERKVIKVLKRFEVENFRNFKERLVVDFTQVGGYQFNSDCVTNNMISKMLIYGRNATGKTNLARAILDIASGIAGTVKIKSGMLLNANSESKFADFKYVFQFDDKEITYCYKRISEYELLEEELTINGERVFFFNFAESEGIFHNLSLLKADTIAIDRYVNALKDTTSEEMGENHTLPFLRWVIANSVLQEDSVLLRLYSYIKRMGGMSISESVMYRPGQYYEIFYERLAAEENLKDFEDFLNAMGVECKLTLLTLPDGKNELYFAHEKPVPFASSASSGTIALLNLYSKLMLRAEMSFLFIDEFDAFYHYEMSEVMVKFFKKKYPNTQVVMTTHNTNLMTNRLMRPDCLFILSRDGRLTSLCDATPRELREGHNLEKLYISGEFDKYE